MGRRAELVRSPACRIEPLEARTLLDAAPMAEVRVQFNITDLQASPTRQIVYVLDETNQQVMAFDTDQSRHVGRSPKLAGAPHGIGVSPDGNTIAVVETDAQKIQLLNASDLSIRKTFDVSFEPRDVTIGANGRLYVTTYHLSQYDQSEVFEMDATTGQVTKQLPNLNNCEMEIRADGKRLYLMGKPRNGPTVGNAGILEFDTSASSGATQVKTYPVEYTSPFAIDEQYRRAYLPYVFQGQIRVTNLDSGAISSWKLGDGVDGGNVILHESRGDVFVQSRNGGGIRQFRRSDGAFVADYPTVYDVIGGTAMQMTSNGRVVFAERKWEGLKDVDYLGIIGASSIKPEDTPPKPNFTAMPYSSHNFLFDATNARAGGDGETITSYRWDFGDGSPVATTRKLFHQFASAGTYTVTLTVTDSNGDTKSASGSVVAGLTTNRASISGRVFYDANHDGKPNDPPPSLASPLTRHQVFIDENGDGKRQSGEPQVYCDEDGGYAFTRLGPATYTVRQVLSSRDAQTAPRKAWTITLGAGEQISGRNFGFTRTGEQHVFVKSDLNANGQGEWSEPSLGARRTVWIDANDNAVLDRGELSFRTDARGSFIIPNLPPGEHKLRVLLAPTERLDRAATITVRPNIDLSHAIGVKPPGTSSLGGIVFEDTNLDGVHQKAEQIVAGQRVFHDFDRDGVFDVGETSGITNAKGNYLLEGLDAGAQFVGVVPTRGWRAGGTIRNQRDELQYGKSLLTRHVGVTTQPLVRGSVFNDLNENGIFDPTEPALRGWTVFADLDNDGMFDEATDPHAATDSLGRFKLDLPVFGNYVIRVVPQPGYRTATPQSGSFTTTLKAGQIRNGFVFGVSLANV